MVKDMQDVEGDDRFGCRTFPVVYGIKKSKWITATTTFATLLLSIWCQLYFVAAAYQKLFYYFFIIDLLLLVAGCMILKAHMKKDFKKVSGIIKLLMIMGIFSMGLVYFDY
jgi:4-hydroxybenzoate polyprenyltransferase